jgi:hypothetical protein
LVLDGKIDKHKLSKHFGPTMFYNDYVKILTTIDNSISSANAMYITRLDFRFSKLSSLSILPPSLQWLDCYDNNLTELPFLPESIEYLFCAKNMLQTLPKLINTNLKFLNCSYNNITMLPEFPDGMNILRCNNNQLFYLPNLPRYLKKIICYSNLLLMLPILSEYIKRIDCSFNNLRELPNFPISLTALDCSYNFLIKLPNFYGLKILHCSNNDLKCLPKLSFTLEDLNCRHNKLSKIPKLPASMKLLNISHNRLEYLPEIKNIVVLEVNSAQFPNSVVKPDISRVGSLLELAANVFLTKVGRKTQIKDINGLLKKFRFCVSCWKLHIMFSCIIVRIIHDKKMPVRIKRCRKCIQKYLI